MDDSLLSRLFGRPSSAPETPAAAPLEISNAPVAVLEAEPVRLPAATAAKSEAVRSEDPKLASLLQRIQQLTSAPGAAHQPEVRTVGEVEPQEPGPSVANTKHSDEVV